MPTLVDDDVTLRPWRDSDQPDIVEACQDPEIQRWTTVPRPYTPDDAAFFVTIAPELWSERLGMSFAVTATGEDRIVGSLGLVAVTVTEGRGELGYWIAPWGRRRGVASAALALLSGWLLDEVGFRQLEVVVEQDNTGSLRVAELAGFGRVEADRFSTLRELPDQAALVFTRPTART
jgi:RimJ/RimL family protein N-acetyltransferase